MKAARYIKQSLIGKIFYRIPGMVAAYHLALAYLGSVRYGNPSKNIFVIGITGTKGKTTTLEILEAILEHAGKSVALISSLRMKVGEGEEKNMTANTMPGRFFIQRFLARAVRAHCEYALIEVTSQGVASSRHRFTRWRIGALTNIAPEHIEAHGSFEKYRATKLAFLEAVAGQGGTVCINTDDKPSQFFLDAMQKRGSHLLRATTEDPLVQMLARSSSPMPSSESEASRLFFLSPMHRANAAIAITIARHLGIGNREIENALRSFHGVPGRMEYVRMAPFRLLIDYAHTPDSLVAVYRDLSGRGSGRLIAVFGSAGGGRDKWKRPVMGKIASDWCDRIILTDEDPYDEDPQEILNEIESGIPDAKKHLVEKIVDRHEAITRALSLARPGDAVVITGKGSEAWIHGANGKKIPWNERDIVEKVLSGLNK